MKSSIVIGQYTYAEPEIAMRSSSTPLSRLASYNLKYYAIAISSVELVEKHRFILDF